MNEENLKIVKPGDLLIYCKKEVPTFDFKQPISYNLHILFVKMIIFCQGSMYTHAAIACGDGSSAVEATPPKLRLRTPLSVEGTGYQVRRVNPESDGALVLNYLPSEVTENEDENDSYAMPMAIMAGLMSVLRLKVLNDKKLLSRLLPLLKFLLYPLGNYIDSLVEKKDNTKNAFFCSEFVAEAFNRTAYEEQDPNFEVKSKSNSLIGNTLLDYLVGKLKEDNKLYETSLSHKNQKYDDALLLKAGANFFDENYKVSLKNQIIFRQEKKKAAVSLDTKKASASSNSATSSTSELSAISAIDEILPALLTFLKKVLNYKGYKIDKDNIAESLIKFQAAFTTPTDLLECFNLVGNYE